LISKQSATIQYVRRKILLLKKNLPKKSKKHLIGILFYCFPSNYTIVNIYLKKNKKIRFPEFPAVNKNKQFPGMEIVCFFEGDFCRY